MTSIRYFSLFLFIVFIASCSSPVETELAGKWVADEIEITPKTEDYSKANEDVLRRMEKSVTFIFNENKTMQAVTGGTSIDGVWTYDEDADEIYVAFIGDNDPKPKLFGTFSRGKLVTTRDSEKVSIKTIYRKK